MKKKTLLIISLALSLSALICCSQIPDKPVGITTTSKVDIQDVEKSSLIIGERINLFSKVLNEEREILISLPPKYNEHKQNYPIVFVMDAEFLFDLTRSISHFMAIEEYMPYSIIIGITNNSVHDNRYKMDSEIDGNWDYGGKAKDYLSFIRTELIPYVETNYRAGNHRTFIGLSPTNGVGYEALWHEPDIFKAYLFLAADVRLELASGEQQYEKLITAINDPTHPKSSVYLSNSYGDLKGNQYEQEAHEKFLSKLGVKKNVDYKIDVLEDEGHYQMAVQGIQNGFGHIYSKKTLSRKFRFSTVRNPEKVIKQHYDQLSKYFGCDIYPLEDGFLSKNSLSGIEGADASLTNAISTIRIGLQYYPNSVKLHLILAELYIKNSQAELSEKQIKTATKLAERFPSNKSNWYRKKLVELKN